MNHVAASGKSEHMASSVSAAADKHLDLSDIGHDAAGDDDEFHDTGKAGVKAALSLHITPALVAIILICVSTGTRWSVRLCRNKRIW
jgi:hypothetical protein